LVKTGRDLLRETPSLNEAQVRDRLLDLLLAEDHGLQVEGAMSAMDFLIFPFIYRWVRFRRRLSQYRADVDEVVRVLRSVGRFASGPA
jgi:hypothetical protein